MTTQPWQQRRGATLRHGLRTWLGRLADVLGIGLLLLVVVAAIDATADHFAQSASAPATIVRMEQATWPRGRHTEVGQAITYSFTVDGRTYHDTEKRTWLDVSAARPKVCYDPASPGSSHFLAQEAYTCAGWNPFQDYGQFGHSRDGT